MRNLRRTGHSVLALAIVLSSALSAGCIVAAPREGYYDHDHHRYYRERQWHDCRDHDEYCR